jgi:hypothetical protein
MYKRLRLILLCTLPFGTVLAQTPTIKSVYNKNGWVQVAAPSGSTVKHFTRTYTFDVSNNGSITKKALICWQTSPDTIAITSSHTHTGSINEGATWDAPAPVSHSAVGDLDLMGTVRRNTDGVLYSIPFFWAAGPDTVAQLIYFTSTDDGANWTRHNDGRMHFRTNQKVGSFHFHRGIIQDADGTMYAPAYGQWQNTDGSYNRIRTMLMKSTDGGANWWLVSDIQYTSNLNYTETTIARCKDGSILAVMRNDPYALKYRRSTDNGVTWTTVTYLPGLPTTTVGVDPLLEMLPNGVLALSYGINLDPGGSAYVRRDCYIAFSADGNGNNWTNNTVTFASGATPSLADKNESTGYTSIVPLRNNRFLQFSDRGDWRYYGTNKNPSPNPHSIWSKALEIVTNYKNRIDLKNKYGTGDIAISTDLTYVNPNQPQARIEGAFDANTDYWNGAFKAASTGYMTIDLLKNTRINGLAICLLKGQPESATISYMADGGTSFTPIKTYTNATHHTVDYTAFSEVNARYIKVDLSASAGMVGLNEIVLYSSLDTYEDYAYGGVPDGYTASDAASPDFWVTEGVVPLPSGYKSKRALFMNDDDGANKELSKVGYAVSATKTLEFMLRTKAFATNGCVQFRLVSGTTNVFRLAVFPNGVIKYYNGTWNNVGSGPVSVPVDTWKAIKVVANASANTASVYVDGVLIGSNVVKETASATSINGFLFASSGSSAIGDKALFDDVELYTTGAFTIAAAQATIVKSAMRVVVSPNPADNIATVTVNNSEKGALDIELHNFYGRKLQSRSYRSEGNTFSVGIPVSDYGHGVYIISVKQRGRSVQTKLLR